MRIVMTTDTVGGVWTFTEELTMGLLNEGCAVALLSIGRLPGERQWDWVLQTARDWANFRFQSIDTPLEWMPENDGAYAEAAPLIADLAHDFRADVIHCNQLCFGALPLAIPRLLTLHSDVFSWADSCQKSPLDDSAWLRQYRSLIEEGLRGADAVVAPTRWMLRTGENLLPLPEDRRVIHNGRKITRGRQGTRKLQAITAGRLWDEAKGVVMLGEVSSPIPLLVAGESGTASDAVFKAGSGVTCLGPVPQPELLTLFGESAIYICPSRYEPFGLAPLEAALCGCAILANDLPSLREVWQRGALYFTDAPSLERLLHELHGSPRLLAQAQARSYQRAQRYTREAMSSQYLALYQEMSRVKELADVA